MKRIISVLLSVMLLVTIVPVAAETKTDADTRLINQGVLEIDDDGSDGFSGDYVVIYNPSTSALLQSSNIKFNGTHGDFYLYYMIAWMQNLGWMNQFYNYLVKLTDTETMVNEYNYESVWPNNTSNGPLASSLYAKGMPYLIEAPFNGSDVSALDNTTSTKTNNYITLTYRDPSRPWRNFIATDVRRRNQGTTSAKRPTWTSQSMELTKSIRQRT